MLTTIAVTTKKSRWSKEWIDHVICRCCSVLYLPHLQEIDYVGENLCTLLSVIDVSAKYSSLTDLDAWPVAESWISGNLRLRYYYYFSYMFLTREEEQNEEKDTTIWLVNRTKILFFFTLYYLHDRWYIII